MNCANTIFPKNLSLKQKSTNEVSGFEASTLYEQRWNIWQMVCLFGGSLCFIPLCVKTVGYGIRPYYIVTSKTI